MHRFRFLNPLVLVLAAVCLTGCQEPKLDHAAGVLVQHEIQPSPAHTGPATVRASLTDPAGAPLTGARVNMEANMSHAGMAPLFFEAKETTPGSFSGTLNFSMPGDWTILLHITLADGAKVEKQFEVAGVSAN